ncbi:MAG: hypothetical protein K6D02_04270 [Lachnospiraceae bacterium]|nr:hypothetical protein [Lachnospiraceae bacterium]
MDKNVNEKDFMELMNDIVRIAKTEGNSMNKDRVNELIGDEVPLDRMDAVYDYLTAMGVKVEGHVYRPPVEVVGEAETHEGSEHKDISNEEVNAIFNLNKDKDSQDKKNSTSGDDNADNKSKALSYYMEELKLSGNIKVADKDLEVLLGEDDSKKAPAKERVITHFLPEVVKLASLYKGKYDEKKIYEEDIISEGNIALVTAVESISAGDFKEALNPEGLKEYIINDIKKGMESFIETESGDMVELDSIVTRLNLIRAAKQYMSEEIGREPTIKELSEYTGVAEDEIEGLESMIKEDK